MEWIMGIIGVVALWTFGIGIAKVTIWPLIKGIAQFIFSKLFGEKLEVSNRYVLFNIIIFSSLCFTVTPIGAILIYVGVFGGLRFFLYWSELRERVKKEIE